MNAALLLAVAEAFHRLSLSLVTDHPPIPRSRSAGGRAHRRWRKRRSSGLRTS